MSASFKNEAIVLGRASRIKPIHGADHSCWQTHRTFVISLQSRQVAGEIKHRTISYCVESDKRTIVNSIEADRIADLVHGQSVEMKDQKGDENFRGLEPLSEGQPAVNVYRPLHSEPVSKPCDGLIEYGTDQLVLVNELEQVLKHALVTPSQQRFCAGEALGLSTECGPESLSEAQPESTLEEETEKASHLTLGSSILSKESNALGEEPAEPLELKITQVKVHLPLERDQAAENDDISEVANPSKNEEDEQERVIVVDADKRVLMGEVPKASPIDLEVIFQLKGEGALELTRQPIPYHTEVYGEHRRTRQKLTLGQAPTGNLEDGKLTYSCRLVDMCLSDAGIYRLQFFTRLEDALVRPDFLELPSVQVG